MRKYPSLPFGLVWVGACDSCLPNQNSYILGFWPLKLIYECIYGSHRHKETRVSRNSKCYESRRRWPWHLVDIQTPWEAKRRDSMRSGENTGLNGLIWAPGSSVSWSGTQLEMIYIVTQASCCLCHFGWGPLSVTTKAVFTDVVNESETRNQSNPCLKATHLFINETHMLELLTQSFLSS